MSSTTKTLTYADLERVLAQLGFAVKHPSGAYQLFTHPSPEVLVVLPLGRPGDTVDAVHVLAVRKHVVENGLLEDDAFDTLLWGVQPTAASP